MYKNVKQIRGTRATLIRRIYAAAYYARRIAITAITQSAAVVFRETYRKTLIRRAHYDTNNIRRAFAGRVVKFNWYIKKT